MFTYHILHFMSCFAAIFDNKNNLLWVLVVYVLICCFVNKLLCIVIFLLHFVSLGYDVLYIKDNKTIQCYVMFSFCYAIFYNKNIKRNRQTMHYDACYVLYCFYKMCFMLFCNKTCINMHQHTCILSDIFSLLRYYFLQNVMFYMMLLCFLSYFIFLLFYAALYQNA